MLHIDLIYPSSESFKELFDNLYVRFFPQIERNTYESLLSYYDRIDDVYTYQTIACWEDDKLVGGCYLNYFKDINITFIEFIFVDESHRRKGIAPQMVDYIRLLHPGTTIVIETEKDGDAQHFWSKKMGFTDLEYDYVQPPIVDGNEPFDGLKLMSDGVVDNIEDLLVNHYWKYSFC